MIRRALLGLLALVLALPAAAQVDTTQVQSDRQIRQRLSFAEARALNQISEAQALLDHIRLTYAAVHARIVRDSLRALTPIGTPPDTTTPVPPPPTPPPPAGAVAAHDFEDGTLGPYTTGASLVQGQTDPGKIDVIDDPTGLFGGKVLRLTYRGSSDVNVAIRLRNFVQRPGETVIAQGRVLIPAGVDLNIMRKLFYFLGSGGFVVPRIDGNGSRLFWKTETSGGQWTGPTYVPGTVAHLRVQVTLNNVGQADGVFRQWVDGQLIIDRSGLTFADGPFDTWRIGQQAQRWDLGAVDEVRYWDDVEFRR